MAGCVLSYSNKTSYPISLARDFARVIDDNHMHNYLQITHVNSGSYTHYLENGSSTLYEAGMAIIPAGCQHFADARHAENDIYFCNMNYTLFGERSGDAYSFFNLCLDPLSDALYRKTPFLLPSKQADKEISRLYRELHEKSSVKSAEFLPLIRGKTIELLAAIACEYAFHAGSFSPAYMADYCPSLYAALHFIHENYTTNICAEEVSREAMLSSRSFYRIFSGCMGISFLQYLRYLRLTHAKNLLSETHLPVSHIAEQSGFSGATQFNRVFIQCTGTTPTRYRDSKRH